MRAAATVSLSAELVASLLHLRPGLSVRDVRAEFGGHSFTFLIEGTAGDIGLPIWPEGGEPMRVGMEVVNDL